jgi:hypothetical protein
LVKLPFGSKINKPVSTVTFLSVKRWVDKQVSSYFANSRKG